MSEQLDVLKTLATRLREAGIPYMVSGSVAMNFYAVPRMTRDIDIVVELGPADWRRIPALLSSAFYVDEEDVRESIRDRAMFNAIHQASMVKVDFILRKDAPYRLEEFRRRREIDVESTPVSIVAPEDLILSKLDWAKESLSEMQLRDVRNILASVKDLDWGYLSRWARSLGVDALLAEARAHG